MPVQPPTLPHSPSSSPVQVPSRSSPGPIQRSYWPYTRTYKSNPESESRSSILYTHICKSTSTSPIVVSWYLPYSIPNPNPCLPPGRNTDKVHAKHRTSGQAERRVCGPPPLLGRVDAYPVQPMRICISTSPLSDPRQWETDRVMMRITWRTGLSLHWLTCWLCLCVLLPSLYWC
jgi:hypothetical protein